MVNSISGLESQALDSLGKLDLVSTLSYDLVEITQHEEDAQSDSSMRSSVGSGPLFGVDAPHYVPESETEEPTEEKPAASQAEKPAEDEPAASEAEKPAEDRSAESEVKKPAEDKSAESEVKKPAEDKSAESEVEKPAEDKSTDSEVKKPAEDEPTSSKAEKPTEEKSAASQAEKPAEGEPAASETEESTEDKSIIPDLTTDEMRSLHKFLTEHPSQEVNLRGVNHKIKDLQRFMHRESWTSDIVLDQYLSITGPLYQPTGTVILSSDEFSSLKRMLQYGGEKELQRLLCRWQSYTKVLLPVIIKGLVEKNFG